MSFWFLNNQIFRNAQKRANEKIGELYIKEIKEAGTPVVTEGEDRTEERRRRQRIQN